jgi:hypothetical protein
MRIRIRIHPITLVRIQDPPNHVYADPDPDPTFQFDPDRDSQRWVRLHVI